MGVKTIMRNAALKEICRVVYVTGVASSSVSDLPCDDTALNFLRRSSPAERWLGISNVTFSPALMAAKLVEASASRRGKHSIIAARSSSALEHFFILIAQTFFLSQFEVSLIQQIMGD